MRFSYLFHEPITSVDELSRRMKILAGLGYHGIELSAYHPLDYPIETVAELAARWKLPVCSMLTGWSYREGFCLSSPDQAVRDRAVGRLGDYVDQAAVAGSLLVVGLLQGLRSDEPDADLANERIAAGLAQVARQAHAKNVSIVIEPVNHLQVGFNNSVAEAAALAALVDSPALGYMLDTFHLNIEEPSIEQAVSDHAATARHVHLCETTGKRFGTGRLDVKDVLGRLKSGGYQGWVSVKVYREPDWDAAAAHSAQLLKQIGAL